MKICVLEEVAVVKELVCTALELQHHQTISYQDPSLCLECLSMKCCCKDKFELLIIGDHPQTSFSWRQVVEEVHAMLPALPIMLISNIGYHVSSEHQLQHIKILDEPFHLKDFYAIIEEFEI